MIRLGIDIGGSAYKAALVDLESGKLVSETVRVKNSKDTDPATAVKGILHILTRLNYYGPVGYGFPGRLDDDVVLKAPNLHPQWTGLNLANYFAESIGMPAVVRNDADVAALAELRIGNPSIRNANRVLFLTLGTGIGSALILGGQIWFDTELGHLVIDGQIAEKVGAASIKNQEKLNWEDWAIRLDKVLKAYDFLFSPDLFVLGGAISSNLSEFQHFLSFPKEQVIAATLGNDAGIIGAAIATEIFR